MHSRELTRAALFAALTAAGALVRVPLGSVPFTLQFLFTVLAGCLLGARTGALSQLVYLALGLAGLPVFAMGGGPGYLLQPGCGFLLALPAAAWVTGRISAQRSGRTAWAALAALAVVYAIGLPYMALILNGLRGAGLSLPALLAAGLFPFLPGDALKVMCAAVIVPAVRQKSGRVAK